MLVHTRIVLEALPDRLLHPGTACLQPDANLDRLALVLGCRDSDVRALAYRYLAGRDGRVRGGAMTFGDGEVLREDLVLEGRRISPLSLAGSDHHRAWWLLGLLPYCSESLERLVDRCGRCGHALGWRSSWGIAFCEACEERVEPSDEPCCPAALADDYRRFADLVSPERDRRAAALAKMPDVVAALPPSDLVNLILQVGALSGSEPFAFARKEAKALPPEVLARVVAEGVRLLSDWPHGLATHVRREMSAARVDLERLRRLRHLFRRPGLPHTASPDQCEIYRTALPWMFGTFKEGLREEEEEEAHLTARDANRISKRGHAALRSLADAGIIGSALPTDRRSVRLYSKTSVEALAEALEGSEPSSRLEWQTGLSRPAIEQFCCLGLLREAAHPGLRELHSTLHLVRSDVEALMSRLEELGIREEPPSRAVNLREAMRRFGGGGKPWASVASSLLDGTIRCWKSGDGPITRRLHVEPQEIAHLPCFDERSHPRFAFSDDLRQRDVEDLLNAGFDDLRCLKALGALTFRKQGTGLVASRSEVMALAKEHVSTGELAAFHLVDVRRVRSQLVKRSAPTIARGWRRPWIQDNSVAVSRWLNGRPG